KKWIGKDVIDQAGNKWGVLKDFLINPSESYTPFIILSEGGSFNPGIDESYTALPFKAFNFENPEAAQLTLNVPAKKLDGIPTISKADFKNNSQDFLNEIEAYYGAKENFTQSRAIAENETQDHQSHEGSEESAANKSGDQTSLGDEVNYDKIKGIDK